MTSFRHNRAGTPHEVWSADPRWARVATTDPASAEMAVDTLVVVAAHPDDETLGAGGLIATAHDRGLRVELFLLTAGEASHPHSPTLTRDRLRERRLGEVAEALELLAPSAATTYLGLPDGKVAASEEVVVDRLVRLIGDGRRTLLVAPWHLDGHPDHDAAGRASRTAAARTGARSWHYPLWFWHWAEPADAPWADLVALPLAPGTQERKRSAVAAHRTQVEPLSASPGDEVLLSEAMLAHFRGPSELFVRDDLHRADPPDLVLDDLHRRQPEPWKADERWYEERKRAVLLAALPARTVGRALEIGCSTGVLTAALAPRCDELVAIDSSPAALATATDRLERFVQVRLERHDVPWSWPDGAFDLVVLSETGYFLSPTALDRTLEQITASLTPTGVLVLCHWRHDVVGWPMDGPEVHRRVRDAAIRPEAACYRDRDFELLVLAHPAQLPEPTS